MRASECTHGIPQCPQCLDATLSTLRQMESSEAQCDHDPDVTCSGCAPSPQSPEDVPDQVWIGFPHGRVYDGPLKATTKYVRADVARADLAAAAKAAGGFAEK